MRAVEVAPSPKLQLQARRLPSESVLASVKLQVRELHKYVKEAIGGALGRLTVRDFVVESVAERSSVTSRVTL